MSQNLTNPISVSPGLAATARVRDLLRQAKATLKAWDNRREAMSVLSGMDKHMLRDIGLSEGDVRSALAEPIWSDPTVCLKRLAVERRAAARAQGREATERYIDAPSIIPFMPSATPQPLAEGLKTAC